MDDFIGQIKTYIAEHDLIPAGSTIIAGVSGGADSLALLLLLDQLRHSLKLQLEVAHVNHCLRGIDADADEKFVEVWCQKLNVPFFSQRIDVAELASKRGIGLEEAGREARLAFFMQLAVQHDPLENVRIALAHHLDDQAETILLHLGRGSGLDGLVGIRPRNGNIVRPLLAQSRLAIEQWLSSQSVEWRQDATNMDSFALRNRIRHQVLPAWRQALGYDPVPLFGRTAACLAEDQSFFSNLSHEAAKHCRLGDGLSLEQLIHLDPALQSRVLRLYWLECTKSNHDLAYAHICLLRKWLPTAENGQQICLPGYWRAQLKKQILIFNNIQPEQSSDKTGKNLLPCAISLNLPGITVITELNLQIVALLIENENNIVYNNAMEYFRLENIRDSVVRQRLPGDRIHPVGRQGGKTLKKYFNEQHIDPERRDSMPLIAKGSEIIWLPGFAAGSDFIGRPDDGRYGPLIRLEVQQLDDDL